MMKSCLKPKNLGAFTYRKARKFHNLSIWKTIFRDLANVLLDGQLDEHHPHRHLAERIMWFLIHLIIVVSMIFIIVDFTLFYKKSPTITTVETETYPIKKISFPAVAICSINRISKKAVTEFAEELLEYTSITSTMNLTLSSLIDMLKLLGQLYLYDINDADSEMTNVLHMILERAHKNYNVNRIMNRLSPKCRYLIQKCNWEGKDQLCDEMFLLRKTQDGYCCTFNYARRNDGFGSAQDDVFTSQHIEHMRNVGATNGLAVLLNPQLNDSFYKMFPTSGFKLIIHDPFDHPDRNSGDVREILISQNTESSINLDAVIFDTKEDVQSYNIMERDCLFHTEQSKIFHGYYSFSECIVHCRMRDIIRLCNCVPFFYPTLDDIAFTRICNLKDLSCLKKHRERWLNLKPRLESFMTPFDEEKFDRTHDYLNCDCLPSCFDVTYNIESYSNVPLKNSTIFWGRKTYMIKNHSTVHIHFSKFVGMKLKQDVLYYWYELMSNYGSIFGVFLGISIINIIEILYKLIIRIWSYCVTSQRPATNQFMKQLKMKNKKNRKIMKVTSITVQSASMPEAAQPLHWQELITALPKKQFNPSDLLPKRY